MTKNVSKERLKKQIESLPEEQVSEVLEFIEHLQSTTSPGSDVFDDRTIPEEDANTGMMSQGILVGQPGT